MKRTSKGPLSSQIKKHMESPIKEREELDGNIKQMISTGSTLLDLAISGTRVTGGGIPGGILVEIFGPSGTGKTVLLCEIAGDIQRKRGKVMFYDPEARLNQQFAQLFDLELKEEEYHRPNTVTQLFQSLSEWDPESNKRINGIITDSLAALSTDMEMENKEGDKMGMRRAKEFSEGLRKTCRILQEKNFLMVCSNQVRINVDAGPYGQKYVSPGGEALRFYSSLRLRMVGTKKIHETIKVKGKEVKQVVGITTTVEVDKSSVDVPLRTAPLTILFDYGIDDIRENLIFVKKYTGSTVYTVNDRKLSNALDSAIEMIEEEDLTNELKQQVIELWEEIQEKFKSNRKKKQR